MANEKGVCQNAGQYAILDDSSPVEEGRERGRSGRKMKGQMAFNFEGRMCGSRKKGPEKN